MRLKEVSSTIFSVLLLGRELIANITAGIKKTFVTTVGGIAQIKESFNALPKNNVRAIRGYAKVNMRSIKTVQMARRRIQVSLKT